MFNGMSMHRFNFVVNALAVIMIPDHPGHIGLVEHDNSDVQCTEFSPGDPEAKSSKKLATCMSKNTFIYLTYVKNVAMNS